MVTKLFKAWLLAALSLLVIPAWALSSVPPMETAVQDAGGTVWAVPLANQGSETEGRAYFWRAGTWVAQAIPDTAGFRQRAMTRGDDGSVYIFWQKWDAGQNQMMPQCLVTVHRGVGSRIFAQFLYPFTSDNPFADLRPFRSLWVGAKGDLWVADSDFNLWNRAPDGTAHTFLLKPDQGFGGSLRIGIPAWSLSSFTDGLGRRWSWQSGLENWAPGTLRGVLIWDGKTFAYHATLPGLPDYPFSVITPHDAHHLWAAQSKDAYHWGSTERGGLYSIDTKTLSAVPIAPPSKKAFQSITRIVRINGDWCVFNRVTHKSDVHWFLASAGRRMASRTPGPGGQPLRLGRNAAAGISGNAVGHMAGSQRRRDSVATEGRSASGTSRLATGTTSLSW